jgi:hypothetical protein
MILVTRSASVKCAVVTRLVQITGDYHGFNLLVMIIMLHLAKFATPNASMLPLFTVRAFATSF